MLAAAELPGREDLEGIRLILEVFGQGGATFIAALLIVVAGAFLWHRMKRKEKIEDSLLVEKNLTIDRMAKELREKDDIILKMQGGRTHAEILNGALPALPSPMRGPKPKSAASLKRKTQSRTTRKA